MLQAPGDAPAGIVRHKGHRNGFEATVQRKPRHIKKLQYFQTFVEIVHIIWLIQIWCRDRDSFIAIIPSIVILPCPIPLPLNKRNLMLFRWSNRCLQKVNWTVLFPAVSLLFLTFESETYECKMHKAGKIIFKISANTCKYLKRKVLEVFSGKIMQQAYVADMHCHHCLFRAKPKKKSCISIKARVFLSELAAEKGCISSSG